MLKVNFAKKNDTKKTASKKQPEEFDVEFRKWLPMPSGKYEGLSLPTIFFKDLRYFASLNEERLLLDGGKNGHQLSQQYITVNNYSMSMLPPAPFKRFVLLFDGERGERRGQRYGWASIIPRSASPTLLPVSRFMRIWVSR